MSEQRDTDNNPSIPPPPALPVSESDTASNVEVDELGLPVAMDSPPDDLELAAPPGTAVDDLSGLDVATATPIENPISLEDNGLLLDDGNFADTPSGVSEPAPLPTELAFSPIQDDDLAGLERDDDLSGLADLNDNTLPGDVAEASPFDEDDFAVDVPASSPFDTPATPLPTPSPFDGQSVSPPSSQPTATGQPNFYAPGATVEGFSGLVTTPTEAFDDADFFAQQRNFASQLGTGAIGDFDNLAFAEVDSSQIADKILRYLGEERIQNLDEEVEQLSSEVTELLITNKADVDYALKRLREAQEILLNRPYDYDEALYRVAVVRSMLSRKRSIDRWSLRWGTFTFAYGLTWMAIFIMGLIWSPRLAEFISGPNFFDATWAIILSALAGGIGSVIGIYYSLYWWVAMKQDFSRQYVMYYLVQPVMGFILGAVIYVIVTAGLLVINLSALSGEGNTIALALPILLGFLAGFRQRTVFEMLDRIIKQILPKDADADSGKKVSTIPDSYSQ